MVIAVKRYLQQDISDAGARYEVLDGRGELLYRVRGKNTPPGERIRISDASGAVLCKVRRLGFSALSAYSISTDRETVRLNIAVSPDRIAVRFRGISFSVRGDVAKGSYDIIDADQTVVCTVFRDYAKGGVYLTINNQQREILCIAAAVCMNSLRAETEPALQMT